LIDLGEEPPPGPYGDELVFELDPGDARGAWEATLVAHAFARRSLAEDSTKVARFSYPGAGSSLDFVLPGATEPLTHGGVDCFRADVAEAIGDASVEELDVLRPQGHAFAIVLRVDEPHSFLRFRVTPFLERIARWRRSCDGI